ncbi:hypothetical protein Btru_019567 [Bulinus truncatus]|nr:hypothetical protein Btru_019567 [Bulinus truncatus]
MTGEHRLSAPGARNKVCDWCKHVRHTVNFVDFQEGDVQLQFCSEKCLNQYKMNIFCTEARQHLQHIQNIVGDEDKRKEGKQGELLITPQLWLYGNSHESNDSIKEEVTSVSYEKAVERNRERQREYSKGDEDEEPGELRDKDSTLNGGSRLVHSDDSCCSLEDKVGFNSVPLRLHRPHSDVMHSPPRHSILKPEETHLNGGEARQKKDLGKSRKSADQKTRSSTSDQSKESLGAHHFRKEKNFYSPKNIADLASSRITGLQGSIESQTSHPLLPNWASSQLLAMMPPHLNSGINLGAVSYAANPLLYSSLFGTSHLNSHTEKEHQVKSRHESRRELLRDRDRFTDQGDRKREKSTTVPLSPSTSHSSADTPGPATTSGSVGLHPHPAIHPQMLAELARHFPHNHLLLGDTAPTSPLSHYFTNPSLAGLLPFPFPVNQSHHPPRTVMTTPAVHNTPSTSTTQPQVPPPQPPLQYPGLPPVTVMVPYPVAVPIPIPLPVPIPISPDKLLAYFREKSETEKPNVKKTSSFPYNRSRSPDEVRPRASSANHVVSPLAALSPRPTSKCSSLGGVPLVSTPSLTESPEPGLVMLTGRESADSIMTLRREMGRSQMRVSSASPCSSTNVKILMSPGVAPYTLDLSRGVSQDSLRNEDEAMDLSKMSSRSESPRRSTDSSERENKSASKRGALSDTDVGTSRDIKVPRIHIISEPPDPPLSQPPPSVTLPQPLEQSTYSSRRSRILDAPSVPKKSRSPSPERRYIRTVPRDMVEAARRRGLRARVRSK